MDPVKRFFKNDKFAERANIELLSVSPGLARAKMTLHPHHLNGYGTVQGGAIFTLADFVFAATPLKGEWHLNKKKVHFHLLVDHVRALAT